MFTFIFNKISARLTFILIALFCFGSVGYAIYSQIFNHAEPCPLCIAQRVVYAVIGIFALVGAIHNCKKYGNIFYGLLVSGFGGAGIAIAHHHVWLQSLPPELWPASCGMPLTIMFQQMPITGFLHTVLTGTAECAMVDWKVFGISGPLVSMYGYILVTIGGVYTIARALMYKKREYYYY